MGQNGCADGKGTEWVSGREIEAGGAKEEG